jgi:hypothetical protein
MGSPPLGAPMGCTPPPERLWKLTPEQYTASVRALLGTTDDPGRRLVPSLAVVSGFTNEASVLQMSQPHVDTLFELTGEIAPRLAATFRCSATDATCARGFVANLGKRAFRRPLTTEELDRFAGFLTREAAAHGPALAAEQLARALLLSPHFLYRLELGPEEASGTAVALGPFERASALSYFLTNGPPDAALMTAADRNALATPEQLAGEARRILRGGGAAQGLLRFFAEHLGFEGVADVTKSKKLFPAWSATVAVDLAEETRRFIAHALWQADARLETLFTSNASFVNQRLAAIYGVAGVTGDELRRLDLPAGQRSGLLTHGSFLARAATEEETDVVVRGKFVREVLLCQHLPSPPPDVNAVPPAPSKTLTMRERMVRHSADATCAGCHRLMDPIGLGFEHYDAGGRYRTEELGKPIDASGSFVDLEAPKTTFADAIEATRILVAAPAFRRCFTERLNAYAHGRQNAPIDACTLQALHARFEASRGNVLELAADIVASDSFVVRTRTATR